MIYKKRLRRLNFSLLSTNTKWMVFGITSSCSKRRSQCCSPLLCCNTTWSKEAIAAAEMRSPDGPSRSPSTTTFVCYPPHCHFFLELTSISYSTYEEWNSYFYVLSNATASTTNTPFCLLLSSSFFLVPQGHSTYY